MTPAPAPQLKGVVATSVRGVDDLTRSLTARGWRVGVVSGATSKPEALAAIGSALAFPAYYGRNLDALEDCLRDLTRPTALVWAGWEPFAVHAPDDWTPLLAVLKRRADDPEPPAFAVVFTVAAHESPAP